MAWEYKSQRFQELCSQSFHQVGQAGLAMIAVNQSNLWESRIRNSGMAFDNSQSQNRPECFCDTCDVFLRESISDHFKSVRHRQYLSLQMDLVLSTDDVRKKLLVKQEHGLKIIQEEDEMQMDVEKSMNRKRKLEFIYYLDKEDEGCFVRFNKKHKLSNLDQIII